MKKKEQKKGDILSFILAINNAGYNVVFEPYILKGAEVGEVTVILQTREKVPQYGGFHTALWLVNKKRAEIYIEKFEEALKKKNLGIII